MKKTLIIFPLAALLFGLVLSPGLALAAQDFGKRTPTETITDVTGIYNLLSDIFTILYSLFFAVAAFFLLYAAFLYLTAQGEEEKLKKAKNVLVYAIIAIVVALVSLGIDNIVASVVK